MQIRLVKSTRTDTGGCSFPLKFNNCRNGLPGCYTILQCVVQSVKIYKHSYAKRLVMLDAIAMRSLWVRARTTYFYLLLACDGTHFLGIRAGVQVRQYSVRAANTNYKRFVVAMR